MAADLYKKTQSVRPNNEQIAKVIKAPVSNRICPLCGKAYADFIGAPEEAAESYVGTNGMINGVKLTEEVVGALRRGPYGRNGKGRAFIVIANLIAHTTGGGRTAGGAGEELGEY